MSATPPVHSSPGTPLGTAYRVLTPRLLLRCLPVHAVPIEAFDILGQRLL